jgi:hypothetical protein
MIGDLSRRLRPALKWRHLRWALAAAMVPPVLWACTTHPLEQPDPLPETQTDQYLEVNPIRDVDIVFAIDNSPSMEQEQENLGRNFPAFIDELKKIPGGLPNVHIGIINSDVGAGPTTPGQCLRPGGDRGIFQVKQGCGLDPAQARYLVSLNNGTMNNFQGDMARVFSCLADIGTLGCGYEHQLQAARVALADPQSGGPTENQGFLRRDAYLALIFITDEDDCSADPRTDLFASDDKYPMMQPSLRCSIEGHLCNGRKPVGMDGFQSPLEQCKAAEETKLIKINEFVEFFRRLKPGRPEKIITSAIMGWPNNPTGAIYKYVKGRNGDIEENPICSSQRNGSAAVGLRMKAFVDEMGGNVYSICQDDFRPALKQIGEVLAAKLQNTCVAAPIVDNDDKKPGLQADCQIIDRKIAGAGFMEAPLPQCSMAGGKKPCWNLVPSSDCRASGYKIDVDRGGQMAPPGTQLAMKCLTCTKATDPRCQRPMD